MSISITGDGVLTGLLAIPETVTVTNTAAPATTNIDVLTQSILYYTTNATTDIAVNIRGNGAVSFGSICDVSKAYTVVLMMKNGATAYRPTVFRVDNVAVTPVWSGGVAPTSGTFNSIDVYTLTVIKTAATPTYTILATLSSFA